MPVRATTISSTQSLQFERRAARQQRQAERQAERQKAKEVKTNPAPVSSPVKTPANADAAATKASAETPKTETKNFIGNTAGANVVNFAVQGGRASNRLAIFGSGEGPKAVKPAVKAEEKKAEPTSETGDAKVDTVA